MYSKLSPSLRAYPVGATIEAMVGQDWYLYDDRNQNEFWKFGLITWKTKAAMHGLLDSTVSVYPISFFKIYFGVGGTYRYYNSTGMDCTANLCQGFLTRTSLGFSFAFNFGEQDEFMVVPNFKSMALSHPQSNKRFVDESEFLVGAAGGDTMDQASLFVGKTLRRGNILGLYLKQSQFRNTLKQNEMQLIVMNWDWKATALSVGLGRYSSDFHAPGITGTIEYDWKWSEGLSLF